MPKKLKNIPNFRNEDEERKYWADHDSTEHVDWDKADVVLFPKLKPSKRKISLCLSDSMLNELRILSNKQHIPYQALMRMFLKERIDAELKR